jgi:hypothetical protein
MGLHYARDARSAIYKCHVTVPARFCELLSLWSGFVVLAPLVRIQSNHIAVSISSRIIKCQTGECSYWNLIVGVSKYRFIWSFRKKTSIAIEFFFPSFGVTPAANGAFVSITASCVSVTTVVLVGWAIKMRRTHSVWLTHSILTHFRITLTGYASNLTTVCGSLHSPAQWCGRIWVLLHPSCHSFDTIICLKPGI